MITKINDYFTNGCGRCKRFATPDCSTRRWANGLSALRALCIASGLVETVKWGHPCYMYKGRNIAVLGAFRDDFRITFMNAALLKDNNGLLEKPGLNTRQPNMIRFRENDQVAALEPVITAYLKEAMIYAQAGIKPPKVHAVISLPDELAKALEADLDLAEAFHRLTPGRQKSYVINLNSAIKPETRLSRIAGFRAKIIAGKGAQDR
jgi:uncharacterized protein YdeI (YjbR/CyaY-like superfamily)